MSAFIDDATHIVYNEASDELGLAYANLPALFSGTNSIQDSYLAQPGVFKAQQLAVKEGECLFMSLSKVLTKDTTALSVVPRRCLLTSPLTFLEEEDVDINESFACHVSDMGFGIAFPNSACFWNRFPYHCHPRFTLPLVDVEPGHVFFVSLRSALCAHLAPGREPLVRETVLSIPVEGVTVFRPCMGSTAEEFLAALSVNSNSKATARVHVTDQQQQLTAVQRTPANVPAHRRGGASKSGASSVSDGLTTVGTSSSSSATLSAPGTAHSPASSTKSSRKSSASSAASTPAAPRAVKPANAPTAKAAAKAAAPAASALVLTAAPRNTSADGLYRVCGSSNVSAALAGNVLDNSRRGAGRSSASAPVVSADFKVHWDDMKRFHGWKCIYFRHSAGIEIYVVPGREKEPVANLIENLDFWHSVPALDQHIIENECLYSSWLSIWTRLTELGWERLEVAGNVTACYQVPVPAASASLKLASKAASSAGNTPEEAIRALTQKGLVPGQHLFASKKAVMQYISRFPYLLQEDANLLCTLTKHGWQTNSKAGTARWVRTAEEDLGTALWRTKPVGKAKEEWIAIKEARQRLWLCPEHMFHTYGEIPPHLLSAALRLSEEAALDVDHDALSPALKGLTRAQRDDLLRDLDTALIEYLRVSGASNVDATKLEKRQSAVEKLLLRLQWRKQVANWSAEWWCNIESWVAPWVDELVKEGKKPALGLDFFWTLESLAQFPSAVGEVHQSVFLSRPAYRPLGTAIAAEMRARAEEQLKRLVMNDKTPYASGMLGPLLEATGWKVLSGRQMPSGETVYIPWWKTSTVKRHTLESSQLGKDYFQGEDDLLIDYLTEFGNVAAPAPEESDYFPEVYTGGSHGAMDVDEDQLVDSPESPGYVIHCGVRHEAGSLGAELVEALFAYPPWFPTVLKLVKAMGWTTSWCKALDATLIVNSCALEREPSAFQGKNCVNHALLKAGEDYFTDSNDDELGKTALIRFLQTHGFPREGGEYVPPSEPEEKVAQAAATVKVVKKVEKPAAPQPAVQAQTSPVPASSPVVPGTESTVASSASVMEYLGQEYPVDTAEAFVLAAIQEPSPHYGTIYTKLKYIGWCSTWYKPLDKTLVIAAWAFQLAPQAFAFSKAGVKPTCLTLEPLTRDVDYFEDTKEGHEALLLHLRTYGLLRAPAAPTTTGKGRKGTSSNSAPAVLAPVITAVPLLNVPEASGRRRTMSTSSISNTARLSEPVYSKIPEFTEKGVRLRGLFHAKRSYEYDLLEQVFAKQPQVGIIIGLLKLHFYWGVHFCTRIDDYNNLLCASWSVSVPDAYSRVGNEFTLVQPELLVENLDYFRDSSDGRKAMVQCLKEHGLSAPPGRSLFVPEPETTNAAKALAQAHQASRKRKADGDNAEVEEERPQTAVVKAAAAPKGKPSTATSKADRQRSSSCSDVDSDTVKGFCDLTLHKRLPSKACHHAQDPSTHYDRLVASSSAPYSPQADECEDEGSEPYFGAKGSLFPSDDLQTDPHLQDMLNVLSNDAAVAEDDDEMSVPEDTDYLPLTQLQKKQQQRSSKHSPQPKRSPQPRRQYGTPADDDEDAYGKDLIHHLSCSNPNINHIYHILRDNYGWSYEYLTEFSRLPDGERPCGASVIYFRKGKSFSSTDLVRNEDYFVSGESLIDYLQVDLGLKAMPQEQSESKKPRATRSGRILDIGAGGSIPAMRSGSASVTGTPDMTASRKTTSATPPGSAVSLANQKRGRTGSFTEDINEPPAAKRVRGGSIASAPTADSVAESSAPSAPVATSRSRAGSILAGAAVSTVAATPAVKLRARVSSSLASAALRAPSTLRARAELALQKLNAACYQSAYSAGDPSRALSAVPVEREAEHLQLMQQCVRALRRGVGGAVYLQGMSGMGKTYTVVNVLDRIAELRRAPTGRRRKSNISSSSSSNSSSPAAELGYDVCWVSGAGFKNADLGIIAENLCLSGGKASNGSSPGSYAQQLLEARFTTPAQPLKINVPELHDAPEDSDSEDSDADSSDENSVARNRKTSGSKKGTIKGKCVPLTILVVDEWDMLPENVRRKLLGWAQEAHSSLLLVGLGNTMNIAQERVHVIDFKPYGDTQLANILRNLTDGLFEDLALTNLARRVCNTKKCDVRALLRYAILILEEGMLENSHKLENAANATDDKLVTLKGKAISKVFQATDSTAANVDALSEYPQLLLASLFLYDGYCGPDGWTMDTMTSAFNDLLESKGLGTSECQKVRLHFGPLQGYKLMTDLTKGLYRVAVDVDMLLKARRWPDSLKDALKIKEAQRHTSPSGKR